jgi:hypothetical protein
MALMTGIFKFPPAMLAAYRETLIDDHEGADLEDILETLGRTGLRVNSISAFPPGMIPTTGALTCCDRWVVCVCAASSGQRYAHTCSGRYMLRTFSADGPHLSLADENSRDTINVGGCGIISLRGLFYIMISSFLF